jgi:hypothetical protein
MWTAESPAKNRFNFAGIGLSPKATHRANREPAACRPSERAAIAARGPGIGCASATIWLSITQTTEAATRAITNRLTRRAVRLGPHIEMTSWESVGTYLDHPREQDPRLLPIPRRTKPGRGHRTISGITDRRSPRRASAASDRRSSSRGGISARGKVDHRQAERLGPQPPAGSGRRKTVRLEGRVEKEGSGRMNHDRGNPGGDAARPHAHRRSFGGPPAQPLSRAGLRRPASWWRPDPRLDAADQLSISLTWRKIVTPSSFQATL